MRIYDLPMERLKSTDFHIHTSYSDGRNTVYEYCQRALENGLEAIAFTEHVRRNLTYDFSELRKDVFKAREMYKDLNIYIGCEAKVLDLSGSLDIPNSLIGKLDFITAVFHSFRYHGKEDYLTALRAMICDPHVDVWGHPTLYASRMGFALDRDEITEIVELCIENAILLERNIKYGLPDCEFISIALETGARFIIGSDSHSIEQLPTRERIESEWELLQRYK